MLKLRKFSSEDLNQVLEISQNSFKKPWPKSEFEKYLEESFVTEDGGKIVGFVIGGISGSRGIMKLIAVAPDYRGKGVGKNLIEHILKYFAEKGVEEVAAHSRPHNEAGCAFLKSFGFEIIKTIKKYYPDGDDAYLMKKGSDG